MSTEKRSAFSRAVRDGAIQNATNQLIESRRQPAQHVSPAVLEYRLQQVTAERDELALCLEKSVQALNDWTHTYAPEECHPAKVRAARERIVDSGGTLYYIATIVQEVRALLARLKP